MPKAAEIVFRLIVVVGSINVSAVLAYVQMDSSYDCPRSCTCKDYWYNSTLFRTSTQIENPIGLVIVCQLQLDGDQVRRVFNTLPENIVSFTLRSTKMADLTDICCLNNAEEVDMSNNWISDAASYFEYNQVRKLRLQQNRFHVLRRDEFVSFPNVETLWLDENQIEHIDQDAFRLDKLRQLHLRSNRIAYISETMFRFTPNLQSLDLSDNLLVKLRARNFFYCTSLERLDLSRNGLELIDDRAFQPLRKLNTLNLADNALTSVPSKALLGFSWSQLNFDANPIAKLNVDAFYGIHVETLSLSHLENLLVVTDQALAGVEGLLRLTIAHCPLLEYVSTDWLSSCCPKMEKLFLNNNHLAVAPNIPFVQNRSLTVDVSNNPLNCQCSNKDTLLKSASISPPTQCIAENASVVDAKVYYSENAKLNNCTTLLLPQGNKTVVGRIGDTVELYCIALTESALQDDPIWTLPDGSQLKKSTAESRLQISREMLSISSLLPSDAGVYCCKTADQQPSEAINVHLRVETPQIIIFPIEVQWHSITVAWNASTDPWEHGEFILQYNSSDDRTSHSIPLPKYGYTYTASKLNANSNYTFCLQYLLFNVTHYSYCTEIETKMYHSSIRVKFSYGILILLFGTLCLVGLFCAIRFLQRKLFVWQEEKVQARVQQSASGDCFLEPLANDSFDGFTYENQTALASIAPTEDPKAQCSSAQMFSELQSSSNDKTPTSANCFAMQDFGTWSSYTAKNESPIS
ncbi:Leucine-rich repeat neuronal protein 2 [Trichinella sp. T8]|nr:Leucine-rich repeat neuronal protein 2 [Trichinella sp. T8]